VVTLDGELELACCELVVVAGVAAVVVEAAVVLVADVEAMVAVDDVCFASAGSWPETSTIAIISQAATNRDVAPITMRRRITLARSALATRIAAARPRFGLVSVWFMGSASTPSVSSS
jgi:hypothetical protein